MTATHVRQKLRSPVLRMSGAQAILVLLVIAGLLFVSNFATTGNLIRILQSEAYVGLAATGMTFVVLSGGFVDLSVPAAIAISANALLDLMPSSVPLALLAGLGVPLLIGVVNGGLVGRFRINPVVCTLGVGAAAQGLLLVATSGRSISGKVVGFERFGNFKIVGLPIAAVAFVVALVLGQLLLTRTRFGYYVKLVGANRSAAAIVGARPALVLAICFILSGLTAGLAGLFLASFSNVALNSAGSGYDFAALTAIVLGGSSLRGAHGSLGRTFVGALIVGVLTNMMLLLGLSTAAQYIVQGLLFITAVSVDTVASRRRSRH